MPAVFRSAFAPREQSGVLVIHCSDPRYQAPFNDFLRKHLRLDTYALLAVPGGPQFLTASTTCRSSPGPGGAGSSSSAILGPRRVILIAHDDCRWYMDGRFWHRRPLREKRRLPTCAKSAPGCGSASARSGSSWFARMDGGRLCSTRYDHAP